MKKWTVYKIYAEDYKDVYRMIVPAPSKKEAEDYVRRGGLGIIKTQEISDLKINTDYLGSYLRKEGFDEDDIDVIWRTFQMIGLVEV
jgi:hypothetical protein